MRYEYKLNEELIEKLSKWVQEEIKSHDLSCFIPPLIGTREEVAKDERRPALELLVDRIQDQTKIFRSFLILGCSGMGKTLLAVKLYQQFFENMDSYQRIPLYIHLPQFTERMQKDLLSAYLERYFEDSLRVFIRHQPLLLIIDGRDEVMLPENLYKSNHWDRMDVKMVTFCRQEALQLISKEAFFEAPTGDGRMGFEEFYLQAFTADQTNEYLRQMVESPPSILKDFLSREQSSSPWRNPTNYQAWIERIPSIRALAEIPFLLSLIAQSLPNIIKKNEHLEDVTQLHLSRVEIFDIFTSIWFRYQANRLHGKQHFSEFSQEDLEGYLRAYSQNLASRLLNREGRLEEHFIEAESTLQLDLAEPIHEPKLLERYKTYNSYFDSKKIGFLREGCMLLSTGTQFKFFHKSLVEYFAAHELFIGLQGEFEAYVANVYVGFPHLSLNRQILSEPSMVNLLSERVNQDEKFFTLLCNIVLASKEIPGIFTMAANAIRILSAAGVDFSNQDFSDIQIPDADISDSSCVYTDFRGANLERVKAKRAVFLGAKFQGAFMPGVEFRDELSCKLERNIMQVLSYRSPEGEINWLTACADGYIYQWDRQLEKKIQCYEFGAAGTFSSRDTPRNITINYKNHWLAAVSTYFGFIKVWSLINGELIKKITSLEKMHGLLFSSDGVWLISHSNSGIILRWSIPDYKLEKIKHWTNVNNISFSTDGRWMGAKCDGVVQIWGMPSFAEGPVLENYSTAISTFAFSPDGIFVVTDSGENIQFWTMPEGIPGKLLPENYGLIKNLLFSPNGKLLISSTDRGIICIFSTDGTLVSTLHPPTVSKNLMYPCAVSLVCCSPDSEQLASASGVRLTVFPVKNESIIFRKKHVFFHDFDTSYSLFSPDGQCLWVEKNKKIRCWEMATHKKINILRTERNISAFSFSKNGQWFVSLEDEGRIIRVWAMPSCENKKTFRGSYAGIKKISISSSGDLLAYCTNHTGVDKKETSSSVVCLQKTLQEQIEKKYFTCTASWEEQFSVMCSLFFSPCDQWLIGGSEQIVKIMASREHSDRPPILNSFIMFWSISNPETFFSLSGGHQCSIVDIHFSPNNAYFYSIEKGEDRYFGGEKEKRIRLWKKWCSPETPDKSKLIGVLSHLDASCCSFSPDNLYLLSGGGNVVKLWQLENGQLLHAITFWFEVKTLAFSQEQRGSSTFLAVSLLAKNELCHFELVNPKNWMLLWREAKISELLLSQANIDQTIGLSQQNQRLCLEKGGVGKAARPDQPYQSWSGLFRPIPGTAAAGQVSCLQEKTGGERYCLSEGVWVLSVARKIQKNEHLLSWFSPAETQHVFFILEGMRNHRRFIIRAELTSPDGKAVIITLRPLEDFDRFKKSAEHSQAQQWNVSAEEGLKLLKNIREDQQKILDYQTAGGQSSLLPEDSHNCVSWCRKHLQKIGKELPEHWYNFIFALPVDLTVRSEPSLKASSVPTRSPG